MRTIGQELPIVYMSEKVRLPAVQTFTVQAKDRSSQGAPGEGASKE